MIVLAFSVFDGKVANLRGVLRSCVNLDIVENPITFSIPPNLLFMLSRLNLAVKEAESGIF